MKKYKKNSQNIIIYLILSLIFFIISIPYIPYFSLRAVISLLSTVIPYKSLKFVTEKRAQFKIRYFFCNFIQTLGNDISSGNSLYEALYNAQNYYFNIFYKNKIINRFLSELKKYLDLHNSPTEIFNNLANLRICEEAETTLLIFSEQCKDDIDLLMSIKNLSNVYNEQLKLEDQIQTEAHKQQLEALILISAPFILAFFIYFSNKTYLTAAYENELGLSLIFISLALSLLSLIVSLKLMFKSDNNKKSNNSKINFKFTHNICQKIARLICKQLYFFSFQKLTPALAALKNKSILQMSAAEEELGLHLQENSSSFLLFALLSIIMALINSNYLFLSAIFIFIIFKIKEIQNAYEYYFNEINKDFALYLNLLNSLLKAGYVPRQAMEKACKALDKNKILYRELAYCMRQKDLGQPLANSLEILAFKLPSGEVQMSLKLINQFINSGSKHILNILLSRQQDLWNLSKKSYQIEMDKKNLMLFLPMSLNFLAIIIFVTAPLLKSFL